MNGKDQGPIENGDGQRELKYWLRRCVWKEEKMVTRLWTLGWPSSLSYPSFFSVFSFPPSLSLLSSPPSFFPPFLPNKEFGRPIICILCSFTLLTILSTCHWDLKRQELRNTEWQEWVRGGRRELRKCPLRTTRKEALFKSWKQLVLQLPLLYLHYFFPWFFFLSEPQFSFSILFTEMGKGEENFSIIVLFDSKKNIFLF